MIRILRAADKHESGECNEARVVLAHLRNVPVDERKHNVERRKRAIRKAIWIYIEASNGHMVRVDKEEAIKQLELANDDWVFTATSEGRSIWMCMYPF